MSLFPRPLVPDISVCSPPRPRDTGGPKAASAGASRMAARKVTKPPAGRTPTLPAHGKQTPVEHEIALLKSQLGEQRTEIGELKTMLKNYLGANVDDGTSIAQKETLATVTVGCQASLPCPHCGKLVTDDAVQPPGVGANNAVSDQQPTPCTVSTSERQFVNEMIKVANKWLKNDNLDDIDHVSPPASSEVQEVTNGQRSEPPPPGNALDPFSTLFKNAEAGSSLSMQVNALAVRYLQNVGQQSSPHRGLAPRANPNWTVTRRQEVLTEELSVNDIGEKGLGMRGFLNYQNVPANYVAACPPRYAPMPNHIPQCIPCHAPHKPPEHNDACCPYAPEHRRYNYGSSGKYVWHPT